MPKDQLQERIRDSLHQSRRKHWFRFWWGKLTLLGVFLVVLVLIGFGVMVNFYYQQISSGTLLSRAVDSVEQDERIELLQNSGDPSIGPATAPITIVAFEDFECPFCLEAQPFIKRLLTQYAGDIRFVYKDFPLDVIHPNAQEAAEAAQCAFEQGKFWEFHDVLFANQARFAEAYYRTVAQDVGLNIGQYNECVASGRHRGKISDDLAIGRSFGVVGTPTFFINGELFAQGYSSELDSSFEQAIEFIKGL